MEGVRIHRQTGEGAARGGRGRASSRGDWGQAGGGVHGEDKGGKEGEGSGREECFPSVPS